VQARVEPEVRRDREVEIQRRLLEHHAQARERADEVPADVEPVDRDAAAVRHEESRQQLEQRALAGAVRTQQRHELSGAQRERHAVQGLDGPVRLARVLDLEERRAHRTRSKPTGGGPPAPA
jgi:hypothetical protein